MRTISVFCFLNTVILTLGAEINIEATEGGKVSFKCSHKLASNNMKYLCKDPCKAEDILVNVSPGETANSGRINLLDYGDGSFTVNITNLQMSDSHMYWCAVIRSLHNTYTSINLTVLKAFKATFPPTVSSFWFPNVTNSTPMTTSMGTNTTGNILKEKKGTTAKDISINLSTMLYAAAGTTATLIIFLLATYFRNRRGASKPQLHVCPDNRDSRNKVTESKCDKGVKSDKKSSEGISASIDPLRQYPKASTGPGFECPVLIYENLPFSGGASGSRRSPADQQNIDDINNRIYITPLPSAVSERAAGSFDRKHTTDPSRGETANRINSVSQSVSTEPPSRSHWFGLDVSEINHV
ncbi:uncharacterized protein LOC124868035 isoform X3 [Girardinichthys multiradiatus]|uniref:uncharacterized protein LOC124868035 isoform X3 n=1 Tax=Girardinichthys multiradiatus TaxID=208333 RepID=UPI001FAC9C2E|nr:uncharacterized protein LOC124868035 isoform X3 [Girardinichthys multiradiatus]